MIMNKFDFNPFVTLVPDKKDKNRFFLMRNGRPVECSVAQAIPIQNAINANDVDWKKPFCNTDCQSYKILPGTLKNGEPTGELMFVTYCSGCPVSHPLANGIAQ